MHRLLILLLLFPLVGFSQQHKPHKKKPVPVVNKTLKAREHADSLYLDTFARVYGERINEIVDSLLGDSAFIQSLGDSLLPNARSTVPPVGYPFQLPAKPMGWTSDYEGIFSRKEVDTLNGLI